MRCQSRAAVGVLSLVAAVLVVTPARAAAPRDTLTLTDGSSVQVSRSPFALTVRDQQGRTVLQSAPDNGTALGVDFTQIPLGSTTNADSVRYAPITFEVGGAAAPQFPGSQYEGNLLLGAAAGAEFASTDVTALTRTAGGLTVTVATDDPSGRTLAVTLTEDSGALDLAVVPSSTTGIDALAASFTSTPDEAFHGFGGRHDGVDQHGQALTQWTQEEDQSAGPGSGTVAQSPGSGGESYQFPDGPGAAYYVQNSFTSSHDYGFLLDQDELARYRMDYDASAGPGGADSAWQVDVGAPLLQAVIAPGPPLTSIRTMTAITGRQRTPPTWAQEPTLYRGLKVLSADEDTATTYEAKVRDDIAHIDSDHLPIQAYDIEGWTLLPTSTLVELIGELKARGIHPMVYLRSYVAVDAANTEQPTTFQDAVSHGYLATNVAGAPYLVASPFIVGLAGVVDYTNPAAVAWWQGRVQAVLDLGVDGFMEDFGEQVLADMHFADGSTGATEHNRYGVDYHRATREELDRYQSAHPDRSFFFFTRTGFTGRPGATAYENANFPGDETTDFTVASGLPSIVPDMLNRAVGGDPGYTTDIGGYLDELSGAVTPELFTRWTEASALMPFFRVHNSSTTGVKMPWVFDDATLATYQQMAALHAAVVPLLTSLWQEFETTGIPPERPLWLGAPEAPGARTNADEWLLGADVLVAPVLTAAATSRSVSFPAGCWERQSEGSGDAAAARYTGPSVATVPAELGQLPYFERCGTDVLGAPAADVHLAAPTGSREAATGGSLASTGLPAGWLAGVVLLGCAAVARATRRRHP